MRGVRLAYLAALVLAGSLWAFSSAAPGEVVTEPPVVELTTWRPTVPESLFGPAKGPLIKGHRVGLFIEGGYCGGGPKPEFNHATLIELPRTKKRPFKAAVITTYRVWPEYTYTPPTGPNYSKCARMKRTIFHRIHTKRPAGELRIFDGYFSPPHQVWPPVRNGPRTLP